MIGARNPPSNRLGKTIDEGQARVMNKLLLRVISALLLLVGWRQVGRIEDRRIRDVIIIKRGVQVSTEKYLNCSVRVLFQM